MKYKSFIKNTKALSPIFATLILIAIAVIAGIVVYMFTSGTLASMTGQGTTGQEKVAIQAVQVNADDTITVYATSQTSTVTIQNVIFKDANGNVVDEPKVPTGSSDITSDIGTGILIPAPIWNTGTFSYTITLVSTQGNQFISPSFTVTA